MKCAFLAVVVAASLLAEEARADESCTRSYDAALALSDAPERDPVGLFNAAKTCLSACASSASDQGTLTECESWRTKARDYLAFATFDIRGEDGALVTEGEVSIDGAPARPIPRDPLEVNPGLRSFKVTVKLPAGAVTSTVSESFNSKESRTVRVALAGGGDPGGAAAPSTTGGPPTWAFVVGGIGIGAVLAGAILVGVGAAAPSATDSVCDVFSANYDPIACNEDPPGKGALIGGGVLLVLGAGGVIAGIVGIATAPKAKPKPVAIEFVPVVGPGTAFGLLRGSF